MEPGVSSHTGWGRQTWTGLVKPLRDPLSWICGNCWDQARHYTSNATNTVEDVIKKQLTGCRWWRLATTCHTMCHISLDQAPPELVKTQTDKHVRRTHLGSIYQLSMYHYSIAYQLDNMFRARTILVLGYWVLGNIHGYWVVLVLGRYFLLFWHPVQYQSDSSQHHPLLLVTETESCVWTSC